MTSLTDSYIKHSTLRRSHGSGLWWCTRRPDSLQRQVSVLDHAFVLGLFARFVRLIVGDVKRWTAIVVVTSEKSIARFAGMYNIRFDLGADRKLDGMKLLRRCKRKHRTKRCLNFEAAPALLSDGAISLPSFLSPLTKTELNESTLRRLLDTAKPPSAR